MPTLTSGWDPAQSAFRVLDTTLHYSTAFSSDLFITVIHHETQAAVYAQTLPRVDKMARENNGRVSMLTLVRPSGAMPTGEARRALTQFFNYIAEQKIDACSAVVFEEGGAKGGIVRMIVAGLSLVLSDMPPISVFESVDEAVGWLMPRVKSIRAEDAHEVNLVIAELGRRHQIKFGTKP